MGEIFKITISKTKDIWHTNNNNFNENNQDIKEYFISKLSKITSYNKTRKIILIIAPLLGLGSLGNIPGDESGFYIFTFLASIVGLIIFFKKKTLFLEIEMDDEHINAYKNFHYFLDILKTYKNIHTLNSYSDKIIIPEINKSIATYGKEKIKYLESNYDFLYLKSKENKIYFLPNMLLVYKKKQWYGFSYQDIKLNSKEESVLNSKDVSISELDPAAINKHNSSEGTTYYFTYGVFEIIANNNFKFYIITSNNKKGQELKDCITTYIKTYYNS